jgi:hypothetical protein
MHFNLHNKMVIPNLWLIFKIILLIQLLGLIIKIGIIQPTKIKEDNQRQETINKLK